MRLNSLIETALPGVAPSGDNPAIAGVTDDSRRVRPGDLFVARPGTSANGTTFAHDAVAKGAAAIVTQTPIDGITVPQIIVADASACVSPLAEAFFGSPSRQLKILGVTGTNGKTTTAYLIRHILNALGHPCGMIGTVEIDDGRTCVGADMTTPAATRVSELLATMRDNGCRACAIETSSHALDQGRVGGVSFAGAGFTNLTGDHLDYHKTMDAYGDAKAKLFAGLAADAVAAINVDSPERGRMTRAARGRVVTFGIDQAADYRATDYLITAQGTNFILATPDGRADVWTQLVGRHNIENALCAITLVCEVFGLPAVAVANALKTAAGAPGRLQPVNAGQSFAVLVDYAHTDDALRNVLTALRPLTVGRLRVVFGCGGDRDPTKRPRMAKVAGQLADDVYVTSDNPRTEDPRAIIGQVVAGFDTAATGRFLVEADRRAAIERALSDAEPGDVVLIAGKGHENYQIVGTTKHPFDDVDEARRVLEAVAS